MRGLLQTMSFIQVFCLNTHCCKIRVNSVAQLELFLGQKCHWWSSQSSSWSSSPPCTCWGRRKSRIYRTRVYFQVGCERRPGNVVKCTKEFLAHSKIQGPLAQISSGSNSSPSGTASIFNLQLIFKVLRNYLKTVLWMVNKKNVSFVRKLKLENGDLNLLATFFWGGNEKGWMA